MNDLEEQIKLYARKIGFDKIAFADAEKELETEHRRYLKFIQNGMHGEMEYLGKYIQARKRINGPEILEGAKTIICLAKSYSRSKEELDSDPAVVKKIAKYARGKDYHTHVRRKLQKLVSFVKSLGKDIQARSICDIEPVMERVWAARSGLGFVGKNGLIIAPGLGSFIVLGEVITTLKLSPDDPIKERCGSCQRCLDACPTRAFVEPFVLDPRKCISYFTIEKKGYPESNFQDKIGDHLFGCDDCQDTCPFNKTKPSNFEETIDFHPNKKWKNVKLSDFVQDDSQWNELSNGSPIRRAGKSGMLKNALLVAKHTMEHSNQKEEQNVAIELFQRASQCDDDLNKTFAEDFLKHI